MKKFVLLLLSFAICILLQQAFYKGYFMTNISFTEEKLIPRKVLFGNPDRISVTLSKDGKYIGYIAPKDGVLNVWIAPVDDLSQATPITDDNERGIRSYGWSYDNEHILFSKDYKGDENQRIYTYNINTKLTKLITPESGVKAVLFSSSAKFPNEMIIGLNDRDNKYFDVYRYNIATGDKKLVFQNDEYIGFVFDNDMNIRFGQYTNDDGEFELYELKDNKFSLFMTIAFDDSQTTDIVGFNKTGDILYLLDSRERNTSALTSWDLTTGKQYIIAEDPKADIDLFTVHPTEKTIQAVAVEYEKTTYKVLDDAIAKDMEYLQSLNAGNLNITSRTLDDKTWLVAYGADNAPVKYYKYDRAAKKAEFLFANKKDLENYKLSEMHPVIIKSRDGLDMVSYITYPTEGKPSKPVPMVLFVHGGPYGIRDSWGLNPVHQFLANRGYAVLSVNYRGSGGFGKNFLNAGVREWGLKMHDDLIDAVNWAIDQKIADPAKVAIKGGSYGGYATLAGLTFTPDVFACGVDIVGPSNIVSLIQNFPSYWRPMLNNYKRRVGDPDNPEDLKLLEKISPLFSVDRIKKPLFIAQGAHDPRVKQLESDQIVDAMRKHHIPVMYALYADEGHGFARPENRLSHYALTEQFLARILKGRAEHIGDSLNGANFTLNGKEVKDGAEAEKVVDESVR